MSASISPLSSLAGRHSSRDRSLACWRSRGCVGLASFRGRVILLALAWLGALFAPQSAWAAVQKVCPRIDIDLEDGGNGETYWNGSRIWAEAEAAGMRVRVRTYQVTQTNGVFGCNWNALVQDQYGYLDATGCSAAIETGHATRGCFLMELRSYGDPDLSVGPTGGCSTTDPGCNLFVWSGSGQLEASLAYVAGPLYPDGTIHYDHVGAPETVQNYVTMAYAYRKWGRAVGVAPAAGEVFADDRPKVNVFLTGDEHVCGCIGASTLARTCVLPQLSGPLSHHANVCIPDLSGFRGPEKKFLLTHQWGHVALYLPAALAGTSLGLARDCSYPSVGGTDQSHHLESREWSGCALAEGFAHFVAADVWNEHGVDADGVFTSWELCGDQAGGVGDRRVRLETGGVDPKCSEKYLDTKLAGGTSTAGQGSELDWLRFFWDYHTDQTTLGGSEAPTHRTLMSTLAHVLAPGPTQQDAFLAYRNALVQTHGCAIARDRFMPRATANGVDHCVAPTCPDLTCVAEGPSDVGAVVRPPVNVSWDGLTTERVGTALRNQTIVTARLRSVHTGNVTVRGQAQVVTDAATGRRRLDELLGSYPVIAPGGERAVSIDVAALGPVLFDLGSPAKLRMVLEVYDAQGQHFARVVSPTVYLHRERLNTAGTDVALLLYGHRALQERFFGGRLGLWRANLFSTFSVAPNPANVRFEDLPITFDPATDPHLVGGGRVVISNWNL